MKSILNSYEQRIVDRIDNEIGSEFNKIHRASLLIEEYKQRSECLQNKIKKNFKIEENDTLFPTTSQQEESASTTVDDHIKKLDDVGDIIKSKIEKITEVMNGVQYEVEQVQKLKTLVRYLKVLQHIQEISQDLTNAVNGRDEGKMVNLYLTLYEENDRENSVLGRLWNVDAPVLKSYAISTASKWHSLLKTKFSSEFTAILKAMRWGQIEHDSLTYSPSKDNTAKAQLLAEYLLLIKSPSDETELLQVITPSIMCPPLTTVTKLLLAPYRQRFTYHFTGTRQTNRLDKPEWFFTQILNWGKIAHLFVGKTFQQAAVNAGKVDLNIRLEFIRGLIQLTIEKLAADIEEISADENLFAHLIDETLAFESEMRLAFGYPASFPSSISVLTQPVYLLKWITLEEQFCAEKMDLILQSEHPWLFIDPNIFDDELKIPRCADQFMRLLEAIKDRYCALLQPGHQLQFLNLQLKLIDSFRRRLVQLHSNGVVDTTPILNAINYITMVLQEWGENVHYLHLNTALFGPNANDIISVFEDPISELKHWTEQLIKNLSTKLVNEIKAKSMSYRRDNWATMQEHNSKEPFILSASAGEMFQVMVTILHNLERELSSNLFTITLRLIAKQIDDYIMDYMIMNTKFNPPGAAQFNYDMTRNLFALFGQYSRRPDLLFKKIHDANKLLNVSCGVALLLHETLRNATTPEEKSKALKEVGIINITSQTCMEVLERRTDIRIC
ncbi:RINT1-like protein [Teleopsis dalmanni]|uniref:RINT1-like protein n=1 Tax=Teleopsis dalmanni TaxID=139649 RepID=UPI0018CFC34E|nr:RINT1-like protein [Teleopsis dalmanni]